MTVINPAAPLEPGVSTGTSDSLRAPHAQCPAALRMAVDIALAAPVPCAVVWGSEQAVLGNPAFLALFGLADAGLGQPLAKLFPASAEPLRAALARVIQGERTTLADLPAHLGRAAVATGTERLDGHFTPLHAEQKPVLGALLTVVAPPQPKDHTSLQRRLADQQRANQASEERLRLALDATNAVGTWDWHIREDRFIADAHFALMHQVAPLQAGHRPIGDYLAAVHPDDRVFVARQIKTCVHGSGEFAEEYRLLQADSTWRWVFARGRCFRDDHGRPARFIGASIDITERKLAERALRELNETLEQRVTERTRALADANRRLLAEAQERERTEELLRHAQKMEAVGQLTGGIAHDFNNMLTGIMGSLELMNRYLAKGRTEDISRLSDAALASAQRAAALTHRLLSFSRRQSLDRQRIDPNQLVQSLEDLLVRTTGEHIELRLDLNDDTWLVHTDPNQLESALLNLVINARDAMPNGGRLTIGSANRAFSDPQANQPMEAVRPGEYAVLSVRDNGSGMSAATRAKAFDPFFTTKPTGQGTGLGLSMIYGFAQQSGGHVTLHSEPGQGTDVSIYLPRYVETSGPHAATVVQAHAPLAQQGESVLVVEDDPAVRMLILNVLDELGYHGHAAADAQAAIPLLESALRVDLLITDVGLPGINGRQLAEIARKRRVGLKVLFMTGYIDKAADREAYLEDGMDIVSKPFTLETLAIKVRQMIGD